MIYLEPTVCAQSKMGSGTTTALTYGIAKTKMKSNLSGGRARLQLDESKPVFYFYFDKDKNSKIKSGVYKVTPKNTLISGEYCFMPGGSSTMGMGTMGKVFDFGINN